jgi:uncharacterized protein (TIGR01244 family)
MPKIHGRLAVAVLALIINLAVFTHAQTAPSKEFANISIKNFGQMDTNYFRGAQPNREDFADLAAFGVNTVINLRNDPRDYEKSVVESLGMKYFHIPMKDDDYPKPESIETFLQLINDPANGKIYVHCKGGKHRTGVTGAAYRFTKYGWDYDKVYQEMKNYRFYSSWGHGEMKDFVVDYANKMKTAQTTK